MAADNRRFQFSMVRLLAVVTAMAVGAAFFRCQLGTAYLPLQIFCVVLIGLIAALATRKDFKGGEFESKRSYFGGMLVGASLATIAWLSYPEAVHSDWEWAAEGRFVVRR